MNPWTLQFRKSANISVLSTMLSNLNFDSDSEPLAKMETILEENESEIHQNKTKNTFLDP